VTVVLAGDTVPDEGVAPLTEPTPTVTSAAAIATAANKRFLTLLPPDSDESRAAAARGRRRHAGSPRAGDPATGADRNGRPPSHPSGERVLQFS
jgi:hypothetical protein